MRKDIHPEYKDIVLACACGAEVPTRSTLKGNIDLEICSSCHPFFTGKQKLIDTAGRVEKFRNRSAKKESMFKKALEAKEKSTEEIAASA